MISPSSHAAKAHEHFYQTHFLLSLSNTSNCWPRKEFPRWVALQQWPWKGGSTSPKYFPSKLSPFEAKSDVGSKWVPFPGSWWTYHISARNLSPTAVFTCSSPQWYPTFSPSCIQDLVTFYIALQSESFWHSGLGNVSNCEAMRPGNAVSICPAVRHFQTCLRLFLQAFLSQYSWEGFTCTFLLLLHFHNVLTESFALLPKNSPTMYSQNLPLHGHSAALAFKVSTPCLGNYAAGDRHQLTEGIINIINHWNFY